MILAKETYKKFTLLAVAAFFITLTLSSLAWGQVTIATGGTAVTENFDTLAASGATNTFTNNSSPITGGYASLATYRAAAGNETNAALYSFGGAASGERALGSLPSNAIGPIAYGIRYLNNTGFAITSITVTYTGEQWRNNGNTAAQTLAFEYRQAATVTDLTTGTYTAVAGLNFTSLINTATAGALNGNATANRTTLTQTINVTIPAGEEIMLRWTDANDAGNDHGLGIDDLSLTASLAPTAADGEVSGRVINTRNRGLENVTVMLSGGSLVEPIVVYTDAIGRYRFTEVPSGEIYTITVSSKRHVFNQPSTAFSVNGITGNVNFVGTGW